MKPSRQDALALTLLLAVFLLLEKHARVWDSLLWLGDLGNLPCQALRWTWGEVPYRDFVVKNPIGVFVLPYFAFRALGPSIDTLALLTAVQFTLLLAATYGVARRSAPRWGWVVLPLSLTSCLGSCGLLHHPWAGTVGLLALPVLYDGLFSAGGRSRPRWVRAGLALGLTGLFHQVVFASLSLAVALYALVTAENRRSALGLLVRVAAVAMSLILFAYGILALVVGDLGVVSDALQANLGVASYYQSMAVNRPLVLCDFLIYPPVPPGWAGLAQRFLEVLTRALSYLGFPLLALWTLRDRRREGSAGGWLSWLLLSGGLLGLSAYPQFTFVHIRAFLAPVSSIMVALRLEAGKGRWLLGLVAALSCLPGLGDAAVTLAAVRQPVRFPAGTVYVDRPSEARELQSLCDEMDHEPVGRPLLVYPYFSMAYFVFLRKNMFPIQEMFPPKLLPAAGFTVDGPVYLEAMRAIAERPPLYALHDVGAQRMFDNLEMRESGPDPGNPLLEFIYAHYQPVAEVQLEDGSPWIVLLKLNSNSAGGRR